jgi:ribosomal protein S18 acetylase RimI-like enzyme
MPSERSSTVQTKAGALHIRRAAITDYDIVIGILREAAAWLSSRGNPQWMHWYHEYGERILRENLKLHEVYLALHEIEPVATMTVQWSDEMVWGAKGNDGLAGYVHSFAVMRKVGGLEVGDRLLQWAIELIASRGRRYVRLDCQESNEALCRYYEQRGFVRLGIAQLPGDWTSRLFERRIA